VSRASLDATYRRLRERTIATGVANEVSAHARLPAIWRAQATSNRRQPKEDPRQMQAVGRLRNRSQWRLAGAENRPASGLELGDRSARAQDQPLNTVSSATKQILLPNGSSA
jgi:hypothetical protein